jgi:hypothetical protein
MPIAGVGDLSTFKNSFYEVNIGLVAPKPHYEPRPIGTL